MKKKLLTSVLIVTLLFTICGCGMDINMVINSDLSSTQTETMYYNEDEVAELAEASEVTVEEMKAGLTATEVNGKVYYATTETNEVTAEDTKAEFVALNQNHVVLQSWTTTDQKEAFDEMGIEFLNYAITMPKQVVKTNCTLAEDGKTIYLTKEDLEKEQTIYAIFNEAAANSKKISYTGVTNGRTYKVKKYLTISSKNVIKKVKITRNGKVYNDDQVYTVGEKVYDNVYNKFAFVKDGKYVVKTTLVNGATRTTKFTVDKTKPTTNMKAKTYKKTSKGKKITFKDATSGVKKATLNGKTIKSGKVVKKAGKYTLVITDKAGNKRTVKFRIK